MSRPLAILGDNATSADVAAWASVVTSYSIAASTTSNDSLKKAISTKSLLISINAFSIFALSSYPKKWALAGLMFEATLAGALEAQVFDWCLTALVVRSQRRTQLAKIVFTVLVGHVLIPRILYILGLSTRPSWGLDRYGTMLDPMHTATILIHALINEGLIFAHPSIFTRLSLRKMPEHGMVVSKEPVTASDAVSPGEAPYQLTAIHQLGLWIAVCWLWKLVDDTLWAIKHPLLTFASYIAIHSRSWNMVERAQRRIGVAIRLLVLGRNSEASKLVAETWAGADVVTVARSLLDLQLYISMWLLAAFALSFVWYKFIRR